MARLFKKEEPVQQVQEMPELPPKKEEQAKVVFRAVSEHEMLNMIFDRQEYLISLVEKGLSGDN